MKSGGGAAVLFSGGVDSTLVAAKVAGKFGRVHLVTCLTQCMAPPKDMGPRVRVLREKFPDTEFIHVILSAEKLTKFLWDGLAFRELLTVGFYRTFPCSPCKLAIHARALAYCLEHNIKAVYDGANVMMSCYPSQHPDGVKRLVAFYRRYGVTLESPIYWYRNVDLYLLYRFKEFRLKKEIQERLLKDMDSNREAERLGLVSGDVKLDVKRQFATQPLCIQSVYSTYFLEFFFLPLFGFRRLEKTMMKRMDAQLECVQKLLDEYVKEGRHSGMLLQPTRRPSRPPCQGASSQNIPRPS